MEYDFSKLKDFKIKPTFKKKGKLIMKDSRTLLKDIYNKKMRLERKCKLIIQKGGNNKKITEIETEIEEIKKIHNNLKNLVFLNNGIIEIYRN